MDGGVVIKRDARPHGCHGNATANTIHIPTALPSIPDYCTYNHQQCTIDHDILIKRRTNTGAVAFDIHGSIFTGPRLLGQDIGDATPTRQLFPAHRYRQT